MNENDFTFKCPKCVVPWRFHFEGASLDTNQNTEPLDKILKDQDVRIIDAGDHWEIYPNHYIGSAFGELHAKLKTLGARWISDKENKMNSHWNLPKRSQ